MIEKIEFYKLKLPLKVPYHLSFRDLYHFDTFIALIHARGQTGVGETTPLPGYCAETPEMTWEFAKEISPRIIGQDLETTYEILTPYIETHPFSVTPFLTAIEGITTIKEEGMDLNKVELVGILSTDDHDEIKKEFPQIIEQGFTTVKVKVGKDVDADIAKVNLIQSLRPQGVKIRIDANQGYNYEQAEKFVTSIIPEGIELFEQPFPKKVWDDMKKLAQVSPIPLMLDESIDSEADLIKTIELNCAAYVKFKLMKAGSLTNLLRLINQAQKAGLKVVLGNGVAGDIGCYHEALAAAKAGLTNPGEMNGFLKLKESILTRPMDFKAGKINEQKDYSPQVDYNILNKYLVEKLVWER